MPNPSKASRSTRRTMFLAVASAMLAQAIAIPERDFAAGTISGQRMVGVVVLQRSNVTSPQAFLFPPNRGHGAALKRIDR